VSGVTLEQVKAALATVKDPATGRELAADGRAEARVEAGEVTLDELKQR